MRGGSSRFLLWRTVDPRSNRGLSKNFNPLFRFFGAGIPVLELMMAGEQDLPKLIKSMNPSLEDGVFVFCHVPADQALRLQVLIDNNAQMLFWEKEGWTVILPEDKPRGLLPTFKCKKITLNVHSSLDAVGFLAAITTRLAKLSIGVNPVSGYYHDHLFVPNGMEEVVMEALRSMVEEANNN